MKKILMCLCAIIILAGCRGGLTEGEVIKKWHEPESNTLVIMPITTCSSTKESSICTTAMIPFWIFDDEDWVVTVQAWDESKEKYRTQTFYVTAEVYDQVEVGDWFAYEKSKGETNDPDRKTRAE